MRAKRERLIRVILSISFRVRAGLAMVGYTASHAQLAGATTVLHFALLLAFFVSHPRGTRGVDHSRGLVTIASLLMLLSAVLLASLYLLSLHEQRQVRIGRTLVLFRVQWSPFTFLEG